MYCCVMTFQDVFTNFSRYISAGYSGCVEKISRNRLRRRYVCTYRWAKGRYRYVEYAPGRKKFFIAVFLLESAGRILTKDEGRSIKHAELRCLINH